MPNKRLIGFQAASPASGCMSVGRAKQKAQP